MNGKKVHIIIDGTDIPAVVGQTILEAADAAGIYIPRLCYHPELVPGGHCRLCTVKANGKPINACTMTVTDGMVVESNTAEMNTQRRHILEMLFVEGNHFCPFCEASGSCELQALGYRLGMTAPAYPYFFPRRHVDASHPDVFIDRNRCILCGRCVRASRDRDGKSVFGFVGRGIGTLIAVDSEAGLSQTQLAAADRAAHLCPTGSIVIKRTGYKVPYGKRRYDLEPIGSEIEKKGKADG
ncbi:MAG TPA: 2Fe-2S iron-sulfur cluster-binding protein [Spirochaetia bacterium]|nr:2Fe-2S iron-sulfur cluster-binding protein [Spirochaetia bacterium]